MKANPSNVKPAVRKPVKKVTKATSSGTTEMHKYNLPLADMHVYDAMYKAFLAFEEVIPVAKVGSVQKIFNAVLLDHPEVFWVANTFVWHKQINITGIRQSIKPVYKYTKEQVAEHIKEIERIVASFKMGDCKTDYEKELFLHDLICNKVKYSNKPKLNSIIEAFIHKEANCTGIARTMKFLCDRFNIKACVLTGKGVEPSTGIEQLHAWNAIKLDNDWYHVDVTWNLSSQNVGLKYDYLNLTDEQILLDHTIDDKKPAVVCKCTKYNYFTLNNLILNKQADLLTMLAKG
ncbi:MAG: hypothetical protein FWD32_03115, partial [Firmicutes bacterium]|nr:hypothetical protein [Bacillota bacterium]